MAEVLVTGATGFVGRHLVPRLSRDHKVNAFGSPAGEITESAIWEAFPWADVLVHLAGRSFVPTSWDDPVSYMRANLLGTMQALDYCRKRKARLVFVSSYLYGTPETIPIAETAPLRPTNPYALSKSLAEQACRFYAEHFGVPVTILRPFNIFGPGQGSEFLIPSIVGQALYAAEIVVKDLEPRRDYVYVEDFISAIAAALTRPEPFEILNIGSGISHSVAEVINIVSAIVGRPLPVRIDGHRRQGEILDVHADITRARLVLGWQPVWSFERGCTAVVTSMLGGD
jgi:nucleoside-diphosphate-sugar epimerase